MVCVAYGNDPNSSDQDNKTEVWDANFQLVQHLGDNSWAGSTPEAVDSTGNSNGTDANTIDILGQMRRGRYFNGNSAYINFGNVLNLTSTMTISAYVQKPASFVSTGTTVFSKWAAGSARQYLLLTYDNSANGQPAQSITFTVMQSNGTQAVTRSGGNAFVANEAFSLTAKADGSSLSLYKNGTQIGTPGSYNGTMQSTNQNVYLGKLRPDDSVFSYNGTIDEIRVSTIARSDDWLKLEYYSMLKTNWNGDSWITWNSEF